jgi:hypothetical protein
MVKFFLTLWLLLLGKGSFRPAASSFASGLEEGEEEGEGEAEGVVFEYTDGHRLNSS